MATANQIIRQALMKLGIVGPGDPVKAADADDCLIALNTMLDAWRTESLYAYVTTRVTGTLPSNTESRTIGPAGNFVLDPRPVRIEDGSFYTSGTIDYPMRGISEAEFNSIGLKAVTSLGPDYFWYSPAATTGTIRFYPRSSASITVTLICQVQLSAFATLTTVYALPPGYERALVFSLAEEIAADYEREIPRTVAMNAAAARRNIKRGNIVIPQLDVGANVEGHLVRFYQG